MFSRISHLPLSTNLQASHRNRPASGKTSWTTSFPNTLHYGSYYSAYTSPYYSAAYYPSYYGAYASPYYGYGYGYSRLGYYY